MNKNKEYTPIRFPFWAVSEPYTIEHKNANGEIVQQTRVDIRIPKDNGNLDGTKYSFSVLAKDVHSDKFHRGMCYVYLKSGHTLAADYGREEKWDAERIKRAWANNYKNENYRKVTTEGTPPRNMSDIETLVWWRDHLWCNRCKYWLIDEEKAVWCYETLSDYNEDEFFSSTYGEETFILANIFPEENYLHTFEELEIKLNELKRENELTQERTQAKGHEK